MEIILRKHWTKLTAAAANGNPDAQWEVGYFHQFGAKDKAGNILAKVSLAKAMKWYQASAAQGNSSAQVALSSVLSSDGKTGRDFPLAIYWAKRAVAQGDSSAAFNLATIYRDLGKPKLAFRWYQRAGGMGDSDAFLQIGLSYLFGFGTRQDFGAALSSFEHLIASDPAAHK
jgi:TPR repeat protein